MRCFLMAKPRKSSLRAIGQTRDLMVGSCRSSEVCRNKASRRSGRCRLLPAVFAPKDWRTPSPVSKLHLSVFRFIEVADPYQSVSRSLKYVLLFLGLLFLSYFVFEVTTGKRVHPAQYILVGIAQIIFYLLLLSLSERIGFDFSFLIAGAATVLLLSANAEWVFASRRQGVRALFVFTIAVFPHLYVAAPGRQRTPRRRNRQLSYLSVRYVLHTEHRLVQFTFRARAS